MGELPIEINKKKRKKRVMTAEQRAAASKRLEKARAVRMANSEGPKHVHPDVLAKSDTDALCFNNVKEWIKTNKDKLSAENKNARAGVKHAEAKAASLTGYIRNMENYLRTNVWNDLFYGEHQEMSTTWQCVAPAYNKDGTMKRTVGVWYRDIGCVWTREMANGQCDSISKEE